MDVSNAYDCVSHDLIIVKLATYGVGEKRLKLIQNCFCKRQQKVKAGSSFSEWFEIFPGILQGSILEPILCNISINYFLFFMKNRYLELCELYVCGKKLDSISNKIVKETNAAIKCLKNNDWEQIHQNFN